MSGVHKFPTISLHISARERKSKRAHGGGCSLNSCGKIADCMLKLRNRDKNTT